jgi:predicted nucleotidyltransferase
MPGIQVELPRPQLEIFCHKWKIKELALFGSVIRNDFRADSDVDVLISFLPDEHWSMFDWIDMQTELSAIFSRKVDLVERESLRNPFRRRTILESNEVIYAA